MPVNRRKFLMLAVGGAATLAIRPFVSNHIPGSGAPQDDGNAVTRRSWALGSNVTMTVLGAPTERANRALDATFAELETVEQVMSLYRPDSQLCQLNRRRVLAQPHPYLVEVLSASAAASRLSGGAFDITVQPLWDLFAAAHKQGRVPTDDEVTNARRLIDWRAVEISDDCIRLRAPATAVTLNGVAQGFAADRAVAALRRHGIEHALVNAGEIGSLGAKPNGDDWTVGVQHPRQRDAFVALAALNGRSLATSGDYETTFSADFSKHHIFDPGTGQSPHELASVSIAAPSALQADALSTAAMVLGPERTIAMIERLPNIDALLVLKNGRSVRTPGFPEVTETG